MKVALALYIREKMFDIREMQMNTLQDAITWVLEWLKPGLCQQRECKGTRIPRCLLGYKGLRHYRKSSQH